jgi:serine phosphatase RsbU (regulator of sigma subunit)
MIEKIMDAVNEFADGIAQSDDMTLMIIKRDV